MHWKPWNKIYVILTQRINWVQIGILRNLHKRNFNMHWNIFKVHTSYYVYFNAAISIKLFIYIYIMLQACTHRRFELIFPIGGVEVVGNTGTSAEEF